MAIINIDNIKKTEIIKKNLEKQSKDRLDEIAKSRGYDNYLEAISYHNSTDNQKAADALYCVELRDNTKAFVDQIISDIAAGNRPNPKSIKDIENELPVVSWPHVNINALKGGK